MYACSGILFNHESPRRGESFVTKKIAVAAARIAMGLDDSLVLGNLKATRDWGYAPEYVKAMWLMLQQESPDDYVIATGRSATVSEFGEICFSRVGLEFKDYIDFDENLTRPTEVHALIGDYGKAERLLGWHPVVGFDELARKMVDFEIKKLEKGGSEIDSPDFEPYRGLA